MSSWSCVLKLDEHRRTTFGGTAALCDAVRAGADLRIGTAFRHNEHIDVTSANDELIREVMDFRITYLLDDRWVAGIQNLRMPVALPDGFGPRASMSFFLYNQDGHQAIARPHLDGQPPTAAVGPSPVNEHGDMPRYHERESWDAGTNAPSSNFIYDFEYFHYYVRDQWEQVLSHAADGSVVSGSVEALADAVAAGSEVKIAVRGLCEDLSPVPESSVPASELPASQPPVDHEVFIHLGACYYYTQSKRLMASANPVVRTRPTIPLRYTSTGWDFGWLMPRTDGHVARWLCDPYTLRFRKSAERYAMRWFLSR